MSIIPVFIVIISIQFLHAQTSESHLDSVYKENFNWYNLDLKKNKIAGVSTEKAYSVLLKGKTPSKKIIVAVIDGGVDIEHEDLKDVIWTNKNEIPGNGKDDDNNGYIDDVHGWNFLGNAKGENLNQENLEYTRIIRDMQTGFKDVKSENDVPVRKLKDYKMYLASKVMYDKKLKEYTSSKDAINSFINKIDDSQAVIKKFLKKDTLIAEDVKSISSTDKEINDAQKFLLNVYDKKISKSALESYQKHNDLYLDKYLNFDFNERNKIIGDDPKNILNKDYGNNDVEGPDAGHGTMVAGIIAAKRNNGIGINGIADNVEIMVLRVVPDGDERDKDVALAIRYAADNGANIINMSFGKAFSPQKQFVDDAIKYAETKNVLLIHAAGNDGLNNDSIEHYPSKILNDNSIVKNLMNVGASSKLKDNKFAAVFSNYGQSVDLFAPGVSIVTTTPNNKYDDANGTSFSCPVVSGIAALVWSYYPRLTAVQLKDILLQSVVSYKKLKVNLPNLDSKKAEVKKVSFAELCKTGGEANAYKALVAAEKFVNGTGKKK
ncbi:MAG TPA: S8 family peptidase [Bacteroidales bacterium]|nr:S8 family peptidase [Bacteroidales bacterium]HPS17007.1 S8 family peptidase [Bacteroidales bacterium]